MDRAKKKLVSALDGFRNLHNKVELEFDEKVSPEHVCLSRVVRHGFPDDPRCIAYDSVQRLLAIGSGHGAVRIIGDVGVDYFLKHESEAPVLHLQFLVNEGALVTACRDDMVHLWNFRQKTPEIVHSVQLNKEQVTCISLPFQSKWLHVGTERGNVYFVSVATFTLSTYVINWNKAIDLSCRTHPGSVNSILTCPTDSSKILILFDKGIVVLWNLITKEIDRFVSEYAARSVTWHHDGRQFICGCSDGSLVIWNVKKPSEFAQRLTPHGQRCRPITQVDWRHSPDGEQLVIFSGGMSQEEGVLPALTISRGARSATVLEMDHPLVAFTVLTSSPYSNVPQLPFGVAVLLKNDLIVFDLNNPGYPCFENLNPMDIHEVPVTFLKYFSDCPVDLIGALTLVGCKQRRQGFSDKPWPINGGTSRECATGHQELLITGHEDGSLKFWQASGEHLQILYKLKTGRHFERCGASETREFSHGVIDVQLCLDSRLLLVAGQSGQATLFRFVKSESANEIAVVDIPCLTSIGASYEDDASCGSGSVKELRRQGKAVSQESHSSDTSEGSTSNEYVPLKVRGGALRRPAGYQPELVCLIPWRSPTQPEQITSMALNSAYGILAIGTMSGLALVDIMQYSLIYSWSSAELYGRDVTPSVLLSQNSEPSPVECSLQADSRCAQQSNNAKSFMRLNTDARQRSGERRPILNKTQSVAESSFSQSNGGEVGKECGGQGGTKGDSKETPGLRRDYSRSPSQTSQEKVSMPESVTSLSFIHSCSKKNDSRSGPCLWLGTSTGACIAFNLLLPSDRRTSTVVVAPSGSVLRLRGHFLQTTFLDQDFCLVSAATENFRDTKEHDSKSICESPTEKTVLNKVVTKSSLSPTFSNACEYSKEDDIYQIAVLVAEEEVRVIALPSFNLLFAHRPDIPFVKARSTHVRGHPVLLFLNGAGQIVVLSLPTLRPLLCLPLFRQSLELDDPMCRKTSFSEHGLGMFCVTPSEIQKFTICSELASQVRECMGELFVPVDMPEPPKSSFLKGVSTLFTSGQKESVDLDSIFVDKTPGAAPGSGMRSVAKTIPGPSASLDHATSRSVTAGQAANLALQALHERGEKLNATVDATERLKDNAMSLSQRTGKLVEKYEKKKWYNF